jgi:hypothetical protein
VTNPMVPSTNPSLEATSNLQFEYEEVDLGPN